MTLFGWFYKKDGTFIEDKPLQVVCRDFVKPLEEELIKVKRQLDGQVDPLETELNGNYPRAEITYSGRSLPFSKEKCDIPVNILITPNDQFCINDLKNWGLYRTGEDPETLIPKIYKKIMGTYFKYKLDQNVWGENEVWEFFFESRYKWKEGIDCDSWSHIIMSYYLAAGIPRHLVRIVCGMTNLGGHSTVYGYSKKTNKWHHTNSTDSRNYFQTLSEYPTHQDARDGKDKIGITSVWFSFNDLYSWSTFNTAGKVKELKRFKFK